MKLTPAKLWMNCVAQLDFVKQFSYQMQSQKMPIVAINFKKPTNVLMPRRYKKVMHIKTHYFCTMGTEVRHLHFVSKEMFSNG